MSVVGYIAEIWRYPISSLGGQRLRCAQVGPDGIAGDRHYGIVDAVTHAPAAPERDVRWRKCLHLQALQDADEIPAILFPDGKVLPVTDAAIHGALSDYFGFAAAVAVYTHTPIKHGLPLTLFRHRHFPVHLLTTASLEHLARLRGIDGVASRRFRPSLLVQVDAETFVEGGWVGRVMRAGHVELLAEEETKRCGVTLLSQPGLAEDAEVLRSILRHNKRHLGIYCSVAASGQIHIGDALALQPSVARYGDEGINSPP